MLLALLALPAALQGSPAWLRGLTKSGKGHNSHWHVGNLHGDELSARVSLMVDRNPDAPSLRLIFREDDGRKIGYMLLERGDDFSAMRGMHLSEVHRGRGHSKRLLAIWLRLCLVGGVLPRTRMINKPLLSLALHRFGFSSADGRGVAVEVTDARKFRDCVLSRTGAAPSSSSVGGAPPVVHVHCEFDGPKDAEALAATVDAAIGDSCKISDPCDGLYLAASSSDLSRALTLRGGAMRARLR